MGVLDIRMRSATLGNYGSVATANPINLSRVGAILNQNDEIKAHALSQGIGQVGKLVNMGIDMYAQVQKREDERKMQEAANAVQDRFNTHMNGDGSEGSGAFNAAFSDGKVWMDQNGKAYEKIVDEVCGTDKTVGGLSLSADQRRRLVAGLEGYRRGWWNQQARKADSFYNAKEMAQATKGSENADKNLLIDYSDKNWEDWMTAKKRFVAVNQRQGRMTTPEEVESYYRTEALKVVQNEFKRKLADAANTVSEYDDPKKVEEQYEEMKRLVNEDPGFVIPQSDELKSALGKDGLGSPLKNGDEEKSEPTGIYKDMLLDIDNAKRREMNNAEMRFSRSVNKSIKEEQNILADVYMRQDNADFVMPDKESAFQRIDSYKGLDNIQRLELRDKWSRFFTSRENFVKDQKEKRGYSIKDENGDVVWVNAASWGKTDARLKARWDDEGVVKTNPQEALAEINAARSTGNISAEDYYHVRKVAYAAMDERTAPWIAKIFNGKMTDILLAKWGGKGYDPSDLDSLELSYKMNRDATDATGGFKGGFKRYGFFGGVNDATVYDDALQHKDSEKDSYLFSLEEKGMLINTIQRLSRLGVNEAQMEKAIGDIIAPKQAQYYRMTIGERLSSRSFFDTIAKYSSLGVETAAKTSVFSGVLVNRTSDTEPKKKSENK